ncbi:MAG: prephenate dehydrogenase/arogenate dehydrogenase family protein [Gammaproteobacteria bacterium]|nr:prephenate dehydrogenase/arogenate dehydrogenase family protein [Gammaproteobacteria bacterium]
MSQRLTIIGVGLIGGSLARSLRDAGACGEVVGYGRDTGNLKLAVDLGVIDRFETDLRAAVFGADLVVLAVPLKAMDDIFAGLAGHLGRDTVVTDVGSAKARVVDAARRLGDAFTRFVPGHPIAGTEKTGVGAAISGLFERHYTILTPVDETEEGAVARVRRMWERVGAKVVSMDLEHHDRILADTSHLPHMLAFALVDYLARQDGEEPFRYAAGGFTDFTRIASSDPVMWRDICLANGPAIRGALKGYMDTLARIDRNLADGDGEALLKCFSDAKQRRDRFLSEREAAMGKAQNGVTTK